MLLPVFLQDTSHPYFTNQTMKISVQDIGATLIVIRGYNHDDEEFYVTSDFFNHSRVALNRYEAIAELDRDGGIVFEPEEYVEPDGFRLLLRFLETGTIMEAALRVQDEPSEEVKAECLWNWTVGFGVGHLLCVDAFMNHCVRMALDLHSTAPGGLEYGFSVTPIYHIMPFLKVRPHDRMYQFLVVMTGKEWLKSKRNDPTSAEPVVGWEKTFQDFPDFAGDVKAYTLTLLADV